MGWSLSLWKSKHPQSLNTSTKKKKNEVKSCPYMSHNLIWWDLCSCWSYTVYTKWSLCCRFQSKNAVGSMWQDFHLYSCCCSNKNQSYICWSVHLQILFSTPADQITVADSIPNTINYHSTYAGHWLHSTYKPISIVLILFQYQLTAHCREYSIYQLISMLQILP